MSTLSIFVLSVGLAMDAFAAAICQGLSMIKVKLKHNIVIALMFGLFQGGMPLIGYILGLQFEQYITSIDHWIAFCLLGLIGFNMLKEGFSFEKEELSGDLSFKEMFPYALATSIDALAVGITFAFLNVNIWIAITFIGIITFIISMVGVKIGNVFGDKYEKKAEFIGGIILILLGIKILLEHLNVL